MSARPSRRQNHGEDQCVGRDIQIKVGQAMHQNGANTPDTSERNGFVKTFLQLSVPTGALGQDPENRAKNKNGTRQAKFRGYFQVIEVGVLNKKIEESRLNGGVSHEKGPEPSSEEGMLANQPYRVMPDRNAALTAKIVFLAQSFETAHDRIAADPHNQSQDAEKKYCSDCRPGAP